MRTTVLGSPGSDKGNFLIALNPFVLSSLFLRKQGSYDPIVLVSVHSLT